MTKKNILLSLSSAIFVLSGCSSREVTVPKQTEEYIKKEHKQELVELEKTEPSVTTSLQGKAAYLLDHEFSSMSTSGLSVDMPVSDIRFENIVKEYKKSNRL